MTNGEKIKELFPHFDVEDKTEYFGRIRNLDDHFIKADIDFWNAEYEDPAAKNDLAHNLCDSCINYRCEFQSGIVRTKCAFYMPPVTSQEPRWIPVSERLPKAGEYVGNVAKYYLVQNEYGDMLVARYTHSEYWEQMYQLKPISDEVVAWRELPKQYKAESEDKE